MAKKRKLDSKSTGSAQTKEPEQQKLKQQQEEQQKQQEQVQEQQMAEPEAEDVPEYDEAEDVDEEDGDDEEEEEEEEDGDDEEQNRVADEDDEPIAKLLEPFSKDQLINLLCEASESHFDIATRIRQIADEDPVHRKIFVHGLGWDTTGDTLRSAFREYGEIEDCKAVTDKLSGKSKGYGFILFKSRTGARKALKQPQKKIGNRMTACQLAAVGPVPSSAGPVTGPSVAQNQQVSEYTQRKIYVSNVASDLDPQKLTSFFAKFGEIEEGPLGLDKQTGKPKGFCLFVYKSTESARKALEEPHKNFEGHILHCQKAIDGPKAGKQQQVQQRNQHYGRNENPNFPGAMGGVPTTGAGHLMAQSVAGIPFNQGAAQALNPAIGQALTALLASQGAGLGLTNLLGTLGTAGVGAAGMNPAGYGGQGVANTGVLGGYGAQPGLQSAYPNQQLGQGGSGRAQHGLGHMGGVAPYPGH